ncbi:MAG: SLC13 family permease [Pseudomonadota bacterium]
MLSTRPSPLQKTAPAPLLPASGQPPVFRSVLSNLLKDPLLLLLLAVLALLTAFIPGKLKTYPALVDWPTIAALTGLLALTKALETSGALLRLGSWLMRWMASERAAALSLVLAAALLSTVLTNDVALFVVVPLTLGVCRITGMPATKLIIFEALAVNAGSSLTPIGNPQNLFLWQLSGSSFGAFTLHMLPLVAVLMLLLLGLTFFAFSPRRVVARSEQPQPLDRPLLWTALVLYLPFLVATDLHHAAWALFVVLAVLLLMRPRVLLQLDWALLLVFVLMFIDLRLLAGLDVVRQAMSHLDFASAKTVYAAGIAASQIISNVPAAIALAEYSKDWRTLAYAVNVGGFGLLLGSLANLIALRMAQDGKAWLRFHCYAVPFLLAAAVVGYLLLF